MLVPSFIPPSTAATSAFVPTTVTAAGELTAAGNACRPPSNGASISSQLERSTVASLEGQDILELRVPRVVLQDTSAIAPDLAAALAGSLLGHVLFLKGQIPFPVAQLARLPPSTNHAKSKKRVDLLVALDTLAVQLRGTFVALAQALEAKEACGTIHTAFSVVGEEVKENRTGKENVRHSREGKENVQVRGSPNASTDMHSTKTQPESMFASKDLALPSTQAHLVYALGPTPSVPKARVVFALRGLAPFNEDATFDEDSQEGSDEEESEEEDSASENENEEDEEGSGDDDELCSSEDDEESVDSPGDDRQDNRLTSSLPTAHVHSATATCAVPQLPHFPVSPSLPSLGLTRVPFADKTTNVTANLSPSSYQAPLAAYAQKSRAEVIKSAERALSRALAEDGRLAAASAELAPTHIHVLLRAPRRFTHPAWRPRETLGPALDACVVDALANATVESASIKHKDKKNPEGVLICSAANTYNEGDAGVNYEKRVAEEDEMIWWVWDGRLTGFADW